jgi:rare lipoprotein A
MFIALIVTTFSLGQETGSRTGNLSSEGHDMEGLASWYAGKFQGRLTASGEVFDTNLLTAAHRTLPFGTIVRVTRTDTGDSVDVRINDRGPFVEGRVIDLSRAGAQAIAMTGAGVVPVRLTVIRLPVPQARTIQVITLSEASAAESVAESLERAGFSAAIETSPSGLYRVTVPDVVEEDITQVVERLRQLGYGSVLVRSR